MTLEKKPNVFHNWVSSFLKSFTHSPRPPAPRKIPPTASASHSLDTPMMMQPATMLSRAEPTRSPWYSPTLTGFIQQVEAPHLPFMHTLSCLRLGPSLPLVTLLSSAQASPSLSFTLPDTETLSLAEPPSPFSVAQDVSCIFKDGALVSIATEN